MTDKTKSEPAPAVLTIPAEQLVVPPTDPPFLGGKHVEVLLGPHAGSVLVMPEAEADQAINDHWAQPLPQPPHDANVPPYGGHDPLTPEERAAALQAAEDWAQTQLDNAAGESPGKAPKDKAPPPPKERDMKPASSSEYSTRTTTRHK